MKFTILGSGGYLRTPRPCCQCCLCKKARADVSERRLGPCIYFEDAKMLIDAPEDVAEALNYSDVKEVKNLFISHWHPDHAAGLRVVEQICASLNFRSSSGGDNQSRPENTTALWVPEDLLAKLLEFFPVLSYMKQCGFVEINIVEDEFHIEGMQFKPVRINEIPVYALAIYDGDKKAVICMDHAKDLLSVGNNSDLANPDLLFMNLGYSEEDLPKNHVRRLDTSLEDNVSVKKQLNPKKTVLIHIEELWGERDYNYPDFVIPHDGMHLEI